VTQTYAERADLVERISELETFIKADQKELTELKTELRMYDYTRRFNEVTSGEIPWSKLCWPSNSNGELPDCYVCIVCRKGFKRFQGDHYSASYIGGGGCQPSVYVHQKCMPKHVIDVIKNDLY
jgi:hypothetical protein